MDNGNRLVKDNFVTVYNIYILGERYMSDLNLRLRSMESFILRPFIYISFKILGKKEWIASRLLNLRATNWPLLH